MTVEAYFELLQKLTPVRFVMVYFAVYFFVSLLQRLLGIEFETSAKLRTNPKIVLGLSLLYIYSQFEAKLESLTELPQYPKASLLAAFSLVATVALVDKLVFGKTKGIFAKLHRSRLRVIAEVELARHKDNPRVNFAIYPEGIDRAVSLSVTSHRNEYVIIAMDVFVSVVLIWFAYEIGWIFFALFIVSSMLFLKPHLDFLKKLPKILETEHHSRVVRNT